MEPGYGTVEDQIFQSVASLANILLATVTSHAPKRRVDWPWTKSLTFGKIRDKDMADLIKENGDRLKQRNPEEMTTVFVGKFVCVSGRHIVNILVYDQPARGPMSEDPRHVPPTLPLIQIA